jgi:hypothetical protein
MPLYLSILEGASADTAEPVLAIRDPAILAAVGKLVMDRLTLPGEVDSGPGVLRSQPSDARMRLLRSDDAEAG